MRYLLAIAVFLAGAIFPFTLKAQSFHPQIGAQGVEPFHDNDGFRVQPFFGGIQPAVFPPFFGYPSNYPFAYFYPGLWPPLDEEYQQASRIAHGDVAAEVAAQEKALLSNQVQELTEELHSFRQSQPPSQYEQGPAVSPRAELPQTSTGPQARAEHKFPATVFIYRDGREMEVRDYAIFGKTLWVFRGETSRRFPLADFDLEASRQVNEEHGVEFPLSGQRSQ